MSKSAPNRSLLILLAVIVIAAAGWYGWQLYGDASSAPPAQTTVVKLGKNKAPKDDKAAPQTESGTTTPAQAPAPVTSDMPAKSPDKPSPSPATESQDPAPITAQQEAVTPSGNVVVDKPSSTPTSISHQAAYRLPRGDLRHCLDLQDNRQIAHCAVTQR